MCWDILTAAGTAGLAHAAESKAVCFLIALQLPFRRRNALTKNGFSCSVGLSTKCIFGVLTQLIEISNVTVGPARFHEICELKLVSF